MDEFSSSVNEFSGANDEFNSSVHNAYLKKANPKKDQQKKLKKMVQLVASSAVAVTVIATNLTTGLYNKFSLFGDALLGPKEEIQLVEARTNSGGAIVGNTPIPATEDIEVEFDFWMGLENVYDVCGDGISVSFMKEEYDLGDNPDHYDSGYGQWLLYNGIFGAEIDIFPNFNDPDEDHLAIIVDAPENHYETYPVEEGVCYKVHHFKVQYSYPSLKVYYDYQQILEYDELPVELTDNLYLMIGAATGARYVNTYIHNVYVNGEKIVILNHEHNKGKEPMLEVNWKEAPLPNIDITDSLEGLVEPDEIPDKDVYSSINQNLSDNYLLCEL